MRFQDIYLLKLLSFKIVSVKVHHNFCSTTFTNRPSLTGELEDLYENNAAVWCTLFVCVFPIAVIGNDKRPTYIHNVDILAR